jgi:glycosyltransferase involved in cell wall biosynthesis
MSTAPITVVIPVYNCELWVRQALESVLSQSAPPCEVIVIDDGSTDGTPHVLSEFGSSLRVIRTHNQGVAQARNQGLRAAAGEFIAFLDADDLWHPRKLEFQLRAMEASPGLGVLGTGTFECPCHALPVIDEGHAPARAVGREQLAVKNYLTTSSVLMRRHVADRTGGFDAQLQGPEDHDYWLRAAEVTDVAILDEALTGYRTVEGSLSRRPAAMERGMRRILAKMDERNAWRGNWLLRRKAYSYYRYSCAYLYGAAGNQRAAMQRLVRSMLGYPLPYHACEVRMPVARLRLFRAIVRRWIGGGGHAAAVRVSTGTS